MLKNLTKVLIYSGILLSLVLAGCSIEGNSTEENKDKYEDNDENNDNNTSSIQITSTSYSNDGDMPTRCCHTSAPIIGAQNVSPQYEWNNAPEKTKSFVLVIIDKHPVASNWVHWMILDISSNTNKIDEGASHVPSKLPAGCLQLQNSFGDTGYGGPSPPAGTGRHNYVTTVYALDVATIDSSGINSESTLLSKIKDHILAKATCTGYFEIN